MNPQTIMAFGLVTIIVIFVLIGGSFLISKFYRKVEQGKAMLINCFKGGKVDVTFTGDIIWPFVNKAEIMDISVKAMEVSRMGKNGLICGDNIRADINVTFYVSVNKTADDVKDVAQLVGCARASNKETLEELFQARFSEALKTVGKKMEFITLFTEREIFKEEIKRTIGNDLDGYCLRDVAIDYLEQTPLESLDENNIMDAQGIRKIVELTAKEAIETNSHKRNREKIIRQEDVETREKILELNKQEADAEARQHREIETIQARELAETEKVKAEESLKAEKARIAAEEEIAVAEQNKQRQVEVAAKAKERTIAVESERVERDRQIEVVERDRVVSVKEIEKEKAVEIERKKIQDAIRERVMVEKTVAQEQEKIKDTVQLAEAERTRKVEVIEAEREAEKDVITKTKAAEAKEEAAKHLYEESITMAEAERVKAEKEAEAMKVRADGEIARDSASGLAKVKVDDAEADIIKKRGEVEADVLSKKGNAEADVEERKGAVHANVTETQGKADAAASVERHKAEAYGIQNCGDAEAKAIDLKAVAMKKLDGVGREHEEFKLELAKQERVELASIDVNRQIAEAQAAVLAEAMKTAKIDIVGGDGQFLDKFFKSISLAKSVDNFVVKSETAKQLTEGDLGDKLKDLFGKDGISGEDIKNLSTSAMLAKMAGSKEGDQSLKDLLAMLIAK